MVLELSGDFFEYNDPPDDLHEVVQTSSLARLKQKIQLDFADRKRGKIRMVFGNRGFGKSTSLAFLVSVIQKEYPDCKFVNFNAGFITRELAKLEPGDAVDFFLESLASEISDGKERDITKVIKILSAQPSKHFLLVDNLDRLYDKQSNLALVETLFKHADPYLKELAKQMVIVITAAPEWGAVIDGDDLSYLNYAGRIELESMTFPEVRQAIEVRLVKQNANFDSLFAEDFVNALVMAYEGNPRFLFQNLELYNHLEAPHAVPLDVNQMLPSHRVLFRQRAIAELQTIAMENVEFGTGAEKMVSYVQMIKNINHDVDIALDQLLKCYQGDLEFGSERFRNAWGAVASENGLSWTLAPAVSAVLHRWKDKTGVSVAALISSLEEAVLELRTLGMADVDRQFRYGTFGRWLSEYERAHDNYVKLSAATVATLPAVELIGAAWKAIGGVMLVMHHLAGITLNPQHLANRLEMVADFEKASNELLLGINRVFNSAGLGANMESEDILYVASFRARMNEEPEKIHQFKHEKLEALRMASIRVFESLTRQLTPQVLKVVRNKELGEIQSLLAEEEHHQLEFKEAFRYCRKNKDGSNWQMETRAFEAVASFINADGGQLLVGVTNDKELVGVENEYSVTKPQNFDGFELKFRERLEERVPGAASFLKLRTLHGQGTEIIVVDVEAGGQVPVELRDIDVRGKKIGKGRIIVRTGNKKRILEGAELALHFSRNRSR